MVFVFTQKDINKIELIRGTAHSSHQSDPVNLEKANFRSHKLNIQFHILLFYKNFFLNPGKLID